MFLHVSVILFKGGGCLRSACWDTPPPGSRSPREQCMLGDTDNKRAVRILLECILVKGDGCVILNYKEITNLDESWS